MAPTRSSATASKKRRGKPPASRKANSAPKPHAKPVKRSKKNTHEPTVVGADDEADELAREDLHKASAIHTQKPKHRDRTTQVKSTQAKPQSRYAQLEIKTKRIPQEKIENWPQISTQVLEQVISVVREAKRDIANTQRDERRVIAAHNTLNPLVRKLTNELAAARVPPQAKDIHFSIGKLTERNAQVSRDLTTARHSKQLLAEQIAVATKLLGRDERNLKELRTHSNKWKAQWKLQEKSARIHPLLQTSVNLEEIKDGPDDIRLTSSNRVNDLSIGQDNNELAEILNQLHRSLEGLQNNHEQVEGIDTAIRDVSAALDATMFTHLSAQQYSGL